VGAKVRSIIAHGTGAATLDVPPKRVINIKRVSFKSIPRIATPMGEVSGDAS
jgi:hypothetical protein